MSSKVTLEPTSHQVEPKCGDMGLGPSREVSSPAEPLEAAGEDGDWDSSSNEAFVTAVEVSGSEDTALERNSVGDWSLPQAEHGPMQAASPGPLSEEAELSSRLWAMTLSPPRATFFPPLPATGTAHSCSQQPSFCPLAEEQLSLGSDMAALWLMEKDTSTTEHRDLVPTGKCLPVPAIPGLQQLHRSPVLGHSHDPAAPFNQKPRGLWQQEKAGAAPGESILGWRVQATRLSVPESPFLQLCDSVSPPIPDFSQYSPELAEALRTGCIPDSQADEDALAQQFKQLDPAKKWREGTAKSSFTYLLLDPRCPRWKVGTGMEVTFAMSLGKMRLLLASVSAEKGWKSREQAVSVLQLRTRCGLRGAGDPLWGLSHFPSLPLSPGRPRT